MQAKFLSSLLFAVLASVSVAAQSAESVSTQPVSAQGATPIETPADQQVGKVNLNTADVSTLERELIGVGAVKAQAIVEHRQANGPFTSVDQLLEVKGIGAATLEKNRDKLSVN